MERTIRQVEFPVEAPTLTRVAAYARVSSGKDAMLHQMVADALAGKIEIKTAKLIQFDFSSAAMF